MLAHSAPERLHGGRRQFIVITHNPRTMESADWIYGVTMEEPGVSSIVGVELEGAWSFTEDQRPSYAQ